MVGDVLADRYELEGVVGSGGMSSVYRAHDSVLDRKVALKVLHQRLIGEKEYVERFRREALMVAGLVHHNIVTVIDRGEDDGCPFIVFELVDGENLKQLVERSGSLPLEQAVALAIQIANGLSFAHVNGYVHRDVKPQNVLLNGDGEAKVTDFGIARALEVDHGVTQTGTVLGTSDYIAPEQAQGRPVGEHTDMYSLGVVLYEMLTGELPFSGDNFVAVAMQHINELPPRVSSLRPDVPARLDAAVARALAKRPEDRFPTMAAFATELEACLAEIRSPGGSETMVLPPLPRRRRAPRRARSPVTRARRRTPFSAILVAIGIGVAVAVLVVALVRHNGSTPGAAAGSDAPIAIAGVGAYDPPPGDGQEHNAAAPLATDGNQQTYWETQHYDSSLASLGKRGVGLVLKENGTKTISHLTVTTDTPGFTAEIEAGDSPNGPFTPVSSPRTVESSTTFDVNSTHSQYFVVWITDLGPLASAHVNEVTAS